MQVWLQSSKWLTMQHDFLYDMDEWTIALALVVILIVFFELGYFLGMHRCFLKGGKDEDIGAIQGGNIRTAGNYVCLHLFHVCFKVRFPA